MGNIIDLVCLPLPGLKLRLAKTFCWKTDKTNIVNYKEDNDFYHVECYIEMKIMLSKSLLALKLWCSWEES